MLASTVTITVAASRTTPPTVRLRTGHPVFLFTLFIPYFVCFDPISFIFNSFEITNTKRKSKTGLSGSLLLVSAIWPMKLGYSLILPCVFFPVFFYLFSTGPNVILSVPLATNTKIYVHIYVGFRVRVRNLRPGVSSFMFSCL